MKIGKQPKRFGGPSKAFLERKEQERLAKEKIALSEGEIKIYLDDERPCPKGWTLARTPEEFFRLIEKDSGLQDRITQLSFDWYLGVGVMDGLGVIRRFVDNFLDDPEFLPRLEKVSFHSSDSENAAEMYRTFKECLTEKRLENLYMC